MRLLAPSLGVALLAGLLASLQFWLNALLEGQRLPPLAVLERHLLSWASWGLVAPAILASARRWPLIGDGARPAHRWGHAVAALVFACVHRPLHVWWAWYPFWGQGPALDFVLDYTVFSLFTDLTLYGGLLAARSLVDQRAQLRQRELAAARLQGELAEARRLVLEQRLRPHFLFNTLTALQALQGDGRVDEARRMLEHLAVMLRSVLDDEAPAEVTLREELELAAPYLALMGVRLGDRLRLRQHVEDEAADLLVPRLILQPVLENAFLHGFDGRGDSGRLEIDARRTGDRLVVTVSDDGPGPRGSTHRGGGRGLAGVRARLEAFAGDAARCVVEAAAEGGCRVRLELPARLALASWRPS